MAYGREPLVLVEEGIGVHYSGQLQNIYEYVRFSREDYQAIFQDVVRRFHAGLDRRSSRGRARHFGVTKARSR
jgi:hypothetical protein